MHCRLASHTAGGWQALLFASAALPQRHLRRYLGARACSSAPARHSTAKARADSLRFACQARKLLSAAAATAVPPPPPPPSQPPLFRTAVVAVTAASPQPPSLSHHHPHLRRRTPSRQGTAAAVGQVRAPSSRGSNAPRLASGRHPLAVPSSFSLALVHATLRLI
jgi:hypothetical protein